MRRSMDHSSTDNPINVVCNLRASFPLAEIKNSEAIPMSEISKEYDFKQVEERWAESWDESVYYFDWNSEAPQYIIDTPPPYPTGNFHIGNALNWCYIDFVARYKRMRGYNVMFPQGWDCHGLPTEVKVEETYGITKNDVPREKFRQMCRDLTLGNIEKIDRKSTRLNSSHVRI